MGLFDSLFGSKNPSNLREEDRAIFDQLKQHGADFRQPRHVLHYLYIPTESAAQAAAAELSQKQYRARVSKPEGEGDLPFVVIAEREMQIDKNNFPAIRATFDDLAQRFGGDYDGWEASV